MSDPQSPLLGSALEDLKHAGDHLNGEAPSDMKYVVLHSDSAIGLTLLEGLRVKGNSITAKDGKTKTIYKCITDLEQSGTEVPEKGSLELLHMMRNSAQHVGFKPDKDFAEWAYAVATDFIYEFCINVLQIDMPSDYIEQVSMRAIDHLEQAYNSFNKGFYSASVSFALTAAEAMLLDAVGTDEEDKPTSFQIHVISANLPRALEQSLLDLRNIRNQIVHGFGKASKEQAEVTLRVVEELQSFLARRKEQSEQD